MEKSKVFLLKRASLNIRKSSVQQDYHSYTFSGKEVVRYMLEYALIISLISYLFYDSFVAFLVLLLGCKMYLKQKRELLLKKRKEQMEQEFRDFLSKFSVNLKAGYSIENAFNESYKDMLMIHDNKAVLLKEFKTFMYSMQNNASIGELLLDLGVRSAVEEIEEFAKVFMVARYSGGNLTKMIGDCSDVIQDKIDMKREIRTVIAAKETEAKIMMCIPFFIIIYISATSPGYFDILYHNLTGIAIMSVCLFIYIMAVILAGKIVKIEI